MTSSAGSGRSALISRHLARKAPPVRNLTDHREPRTHVLAAFVVMRCRGQHGVRKRRQPIRAGTVEIRHGRAEARRVKADVVARQQPAITVKCRVLLTDFAATGAVNGEPPSQTLAYFLSISPGFIDTMKISLINGRDFLPGETAPGVVSAPLGAAIVNEAFVKTYFNGENPIGRSFGKIGGMLPDNIAFRSSG